MDGTSIHARAGGYFLSCLVSLCVSLCLTAQVVTNSTHATSLSGWLTTTLAIDTTESNYQTMAGNWNSSFGGLSADQTATEVASCLRLSLSRTVFDSNSHSHSYSHSHIFTITCACCHDEIKGTQYIKIYSHADYLILTLFTPYLLSPSADQTATEVASSCLSLFLFAIIHNAVLWRASSFSPSSCFSSNVGSVFLSRIICTCCCDET